MLAVVLSALAVVALAYGLVAWVGAERLTAIGYGETRPVETNTTPDGRARNRRVSILIDSDRPEEPTEVREQKDGEGSAGSTAAPASTASQ